MTHPPRSSLRLLCGLCGETPGLVVLLLLIACLLPGTVRAAADDVGPVEFFEKQVRPLLAEKCQKCHGGDKVRGGLRLTGRDLVLKGGGRGPAAVPGRPAESLLVEAVEHRGDLKMPPKGKLSEGEIDRLKRWIDLGLPWPGTHAETSSAPPGSPSQGDESRHWWVLQPVRAVPPPAVKDGAWPRSEIDRFILAGLEARGMTPARPADKRALLRRATFDLTGLPPAPEEVESFLADRSPDAFAKVVDRLLAAPAYGERWARHWLDVVRYADARDLIQLPAPSDFREAWRYRDWVVEACNRDLSYAEFLRNQIAGDLLPPREPGGINKDGIIATGLLAIADFVPGDVDKDQMIADYVNDQVDVVSRAFLGLTVACARCHDHKFDPISTEDYYALAGIFFSTRLIPGPVPGNTPLVRVPLLSPDELARVQSQDAADRRRRAELEQQLPDAVDREYIASLKHLVTGQAARYLLAATECRKLRSASTTRALTELASQRKLQESLLAAWVDYLDRVEKQPPAGRHPTVCDAASGKLAGSALARAADELQRALAACAARRVAESARSPEQERRDRACVLRFRADDPHLLTDSESRVTLWPNRSGLPADARPSGRGIGPKKTCAVINGHTKTVLRFDGQSLLEAPRPVPPAGSLFVVFQAANTGRASQRLLGWEDSDVGKHGLSLMPDPGGPLRAILRNNGKPGDLVDARPASAFEIVGVTWGPDGTTLHRNGVAAGSQKGIDAVSSDPGIVAVHLGGPGSGSSPRFRGDVAEIRVYQRQLASAERSLIETELHRAWFEPADPRAPPRDLLTELFDELTSARGPFWLPVEERKKMLPPETRSRLAVLGHELDLLKSKPPLEVPQAVAVQDGGPKGTRHEGFKDAQVFLRGNHKKPGKTVPRGWPRILTGGHPARITEGSGRLQLAGWLARPDNPLTARVMINRIWQHHFGAGLVRTANDFGRRGDRPSNPELLDQLAARFVESGWSVKAMHRLIMLSSAYQQSSSGSGEGPDLDPENRLFGRMNRRRLEAEAIRDSLLAVAGRLDARRGGPAFADLAVPRRTVYFMSVRTGPNASDFGRLFDRADPGSIVAERGQSIVAPQALFFLNDPFVSDLARALASRLAREEPGDDNARISRLYTLALGRPPTSAEIDLGRQLLAPDRDTNPWERYCQLIFSSNEFIYID
ncbi:MAG: DUF1553 domain-containing protein [Isosphaerales bacterium]